MSRSILGFSHTHITEREAVHNSPCGFDDAAWEDCTFCSAVEWWRAIGHPNVPATHAEAELLRCASGRAPTGGTNIADVSKAIEVRYHATTPPHTRGFAELWAQLVKGTVCVTQGSMAAFPNGSHWRRWDPGFAGGHAVCAYRIDGYDRVWWCDPLAPQDGTYQGEWMPKATFKAFVDAFPNAWALTARVVPDRPVIGGDMWHAKTGGKTLGTVKINGSGHSLLSSTDPVRVRYGPRSSGEELNVLAILDLVDAQGHPIDIDGHQPPVGNRNEVYLVDKTEFGAAPLVLRADCTALV